MLRRSKYSSSLVLVTIIRVPLKLPQFVLVNLSVIRLWPSEHITDEKRAAELTRKSDVRNFLDGAVR